MAIESMYVFTGDEVVATDLPAKLNENFAKTETNMLKTVNNVAQDENHNINVTELIPKQITRNTNLNNLVTSGEYTFTKGSATITNSPTSNSFFLTVLRNNALVKQVVTEVVLDDPITYTRVLSGSSWSPWVEGGKVKTINNISPDDSGNVDLGIIPIANGGTGATTVEQARANLGISSSNGEIIGSGAGYHNCIYRGKDLGSTVTTAQWIAIKSGTFDDMYLGDYWTIGGVDWVIMAFDYYLNCGDRATTAHHIVIVPRTALYSARMHTSSTTEEGYVGSAMYTTNLADAKTAIADAFGSSHILTIRQSFVNAANGGYSTKGTWTDATVWLMNELNVYGGKIFGDYSIQGTTLPYLDTIDSAQYPAFMFNPSLIRIREEYWLRDVVNDTAFAFVNYNGLCGNRYTSSTIGVRPAFCIYQS